MSAEKTIYDWLHKNRRKTFTAKDVTYMHPSYKKSTMYRAARRVAREMGATRYYKDGRVTYSLPSRITSKTTKPEFIHS